MNDAQRKVLHDEVKMSALAKVLKREFDRAFDLTVDEKDGKVRITAIEKDSGSDIMTVADVAALLQTDKSVIRRMCKTVAQRRSEHPIPFIKLHGKLLRFRRTEIKAWLDAQEKPVVLKGRRK